VHVTDQSSNPSVLSGTFTIVVSAAPLVWTAPAAPITLPTMTVGTAMTPYTLTTTGGTGAVTYTVNSGTLPTGVTLTGNVISGTPTQPTIVAGNVVTFLATDSATPTHVTATSSNVTMIANPVTLAITNTSLPTGYVGAVYNSSGYQMTSTGGVSPITWSMPATDGLTISSTGLITGTPTGTYGSNVTITASDSAINQHQSKPISLLLTVSSAPTITTSPTLPYATVGTAYSQTLVGSGGSGSGYTFTIISGQSSLTALGSTFALSSGGVLSGTPTASGTATFTVQVKDSANNTGTVNFTLNVYAVLTLTTPSSSVPGPGTVGQAYSATIGGLGGLAPYTYQVNGNVVATNGTVNLGYNLILTNNGSVLNIAGTPNTATTITFTAQVKDANNTTVGPYSYSIVIGTNYSISGTINLNNYCGGSPPAVPSVTVTLSQSSTQIAQTTTTNGQYTFSNIPAGTYTITPSPSISGTTGAVFYPATSSVTLTSSNSSGNNFGVALGYSVSGTLTYAGTATGRAYISLANKNCGGNSSPGTSLASVSSTGTAYTIRGVAPGSYSVSVWTDTLGHGDANTADPYGSGNVTVGTAAVTGSNFTITDPGVTTLTSAPSIQSVNPITSSAGGTGGALLAYSGIQNSNSVEMATSYTVQWSTTSSFTTITDSQVFPANGVNGTNIWLLNSATHPSLTSSSSYYFRVYGTSAGTSVSPYGVYEGSGSSPLLVSMAAPTGGTTQTGSVVLGATATGPLYVGFYNTSTGVFYGEAINSPAATQAFSVNVPAGTTYYFVAVQDQNNDGYIDAGDVTNTNNLKTLTTVPDSNATLTLPTTSTYAAATTSYFSSTSSGGSSQNYSVMAGLSGLIKQPVAVVLTTSSNADGANLVVPQDLGLCTNCGSSAFETNGSTNLVVPSVGDTYGFSVTYSDTTTGTATGTVAGVLGNSALATILSPYLSCECQQLHLPVPALLLDKRQHMADSGQ